jgi:predicted extracellular nuclease
MKPYIIFCLYVLVFVFQVNILKAQAPQHHVACVGFYNIENLFDTLDAPDINDADFLPTGAYNYDTKIYTQKQHNMARVISELGTELTPDGVAILGVAEVENAKVLEDLTSQPELAGRKYRIVHYDSPDERGIDVGLLYQPKYFRVLGSMPVPLTLTLPDGKSDFTRDILYVTGMLETDTLHILVNHWPSRRGGESASQPYRMAAAQVCKNISDSLMNLNPEAKIIIMGDLNDDPVSASVKDVLRAGFERKKMKRNGLYNVMYDFYKNGIGTLAYQDSWNLFDQIIISKSLAQLKSDDYHLFQSVVYNKPYMIQKTGQFKGYPLRSFVGNNWMNGYSDHFPVYMFLVKKA